MTPERVASVIEQTLGAPDRQVQVYMLVQFMPRPERFPARNGHTRKAGAQDGNVRPVARLMGLHPSGVRYMLARVEDRREDEAFDLRLQAIEAELAG